MKIFYMVFLVWIMVLSGCSSRQQAEKEVNALSKKTEHNNYIVLVDLSSRVKSEDQIQKDKLVITTVFKQFLEGLRMDVLSTGGLNDDRFRLIVADNTRLSGLKKEHEPSFLLDTSVISYRKLNYILDGGLEKTFLLALDELYKDAGDYNSASAIPRSDLNNYLNGQLWKDLDKRENTRNLLFIITDGSGCRQDSLISFNQKKSILDVAILGWNSESYNSTVMQDWAAKQQVMRLQFIHAGSAPELESKMQEFLRTPATAEEQASDVTMSKIKSK
jgi:hypothetical protein